MAYISFQPRDNFKTHLYTGTGASNAQTFPETTAMQPDIVWIKNRDVTDFHVWTNSLSGATKYIETNNTLVQTTNAESVKSFDSDGFTVGTMNEVNTDTEDFVSWNWKMGTTSGIAGSPSITPTAYTFNAAAGQSIIQWTGTGANATLPHGLGVTPEMIIVRNTNAGYDWMVYHKIMGNTKYMRLNSTAIQSTGATTWNSTSPTDTLFSVGTNDASNQNTATLLAYCFAPIKGYSRFGTYKGNQSANGPFIYTGFRPAFVICKVYNSGDPKNWILMDDKRLAYNEDNNALYTSNTNAGDASTTIDILSNGFKCRRTDDTLNGPGGLSYIYMAFAKFPFVTSTSQPGGAR